MAQSTPSCRHAARSGHDTRALPDSRSHRRRWHNGEVYRAHDTRLDRDVAIKVLPEHSTTDRDALHLFERETKAVAALSHPNILAIHDVGADHGIAYAVTELLDGQTLRHWLGGSAIPWPKAVQIGAALADGLAAVHAKGIIHRDLKPENVFLTRDGRVKILDFGLVTFSQHSWTKPLRDRNRAG